MLSKNRVINQHLPLSKLNTEIEYCPLCTKKDFSNFEQVKYSNGHIQYKICEHCSLIFQSPHLDDESQKEFYSENYRAFVFGKAEPPMIDLEIQRKRADHLCTLLEPYSQKFMHRTHLDIGCGLGVLIDQIQSKFDTQSIGIEPDKIYREYVLSNKNTAVFPNLDEWRKVNKSKVSIVTLSHVLEHLNNPIEYLSIIRSSILDENGLLLVEVPNLFFHPSLELAHIYAFSPQTISEILFKSGFEILSTKYHGVPQRTSPRFITIIAQAQMLKENVNYQVSSNPNGVKIKRSLGMSYVHLEDLVYRVSRKVKNRFNYLLHRS